MFMYGQIFACKYIKAEKCYAILILVVLTVIIGSLTSTVGTIVYQEHGYSYPSLFPPEPYVFCDDLSLSPDEDEVTFDPKSGLVRASVAVDGRYICNFRNITAMVYKIVERQSRLRLARGHLEAHQYLSCGNESLFPNPGHRTFYFAEISRHQSYPDAGSDVKLHWDKHPERSYIAPEIHYHNGEITVPEGRTYFVYASVHVNISRIHDRDSRSIHRPQRFTLRICRSVNGYEQTLLRKTELINVSSSNSDAISSMNIGSHLQLAKHGVIYVSVSDGDALIRDSRGTTFGMFAL